MIFSHLLCLLKSESVRSPQSFLHSGVCLHHWLWIYSWRWAQYFFLHPRGCSSDILQPSHVPHKNCQWLRSGDFSDTTRVLMHYLMVHWNDISHQQNEKKKFAWKVGEREEWLSVCLYPTVNYLVKVTNLITASLRLFHSCASSFYFSWSFSLYPPYLVTNGAPQCLVCNRFNCMYCCTCPRRLFFFLLRYQQGALLIRDTEPYSNDISHMEATPCVLCMTWLEPAHSVGC